MCPKPLWESFEQSQPRSSVRLQNYGFVLPVPTKVPTVGGDALGIVATAGLMGLAAPDHPTFDGDLHRSVSLHQRRDGLDRSGRLRQGPPVKWLAGGSLDAVQRRYVRMCRSDLHERLRIG